MDTHSAILRAADHIELHPELFDFASTQVPGHCGTPGCALGWIGHFAGRTELRIRARFSLPFKHRGIAIVTPEGGSNPIIDVPAREFYDRMDAFKVGNWRGDAHACAKALRLYARLHHPHQTLDPAYLALRTRLLSGDMIASSPY